MQHGLRKALAATTLSVALATTGAVVVTVATADMAIAKSDKANAGNGGNRGGNGGRDANRGNSGKSANAGERGPSRGQGQGAKSGGGFAASLGLGRGQGGPKLFGFLPPHQSGGGKSDRQNGQSVQRSAPETSARPAPRGTDIEMDESADIRGNSWKTRLDDGILETHPRELGMWNSARRNPQAIANMVAKYEASCETACDATGAGGMIGALVSAYDGYNTEKSDFFDALQASVMAGDLTVDTASRLFDGSLTQESLEAEIAGFGGDIVLGEDGMVSCADGAECSDDDLERLQDDADALAFLASDEGADLAKAAEDYEMAAETRAIADASVQPNFSVGNAEVQEKMLADVKDLLDIEETQTPEFAAPEDMAPGETETEPQSDDV